MQTEKCPQFLGHHPMCHHPSDPSPPINNPPHYTPNSPLPFKPQQYHSLSPTLYMSSKLSLLGLVAVAVLFHVGLAQQAGSCQGRQQYYGQCQCQIQRLQALRPSQQYESEGGMTEVWLQNNQQLQCAGVTLVRQTIRRNSFNFPGYNNAPKLTYVVQGRGVHSVLIPGCPETYQSTEQQSQAQQGEQARTRADEHQKIRRIRQGDVVANPTGHVHWFYNDGEEQLVLIHLIDTGSNSNQLDQQFRKFYLGGNPQSQREQGQRQQGPYQGEEQTYYQQRFESNNIFRGLDDEILQEVLGVSRETVDKVKGHRDVRGHMVQARQGLQLIRPSRMEEEEYRHGGSSSQSYGNGFEETICTARMRENIGNPARADVYNPDAGYIRTVNRINLPILNLLQLSAERGVLHRNAIYAPHYNLNAHTIIYATRGTARVQVTGNYRQPVYDGQLSEGQVLVVPQNFALTKQAGQGGFEWVSFKTNANAMIHSLAGKTSAFRALPLDMLASMYQISRQEAENLKYNRGQEVMIFAPSSTSRGRALP